MNNHSSISSPSCYLVKRNADGSVSPQDLQRAKQVFGLAHDEEVAMLTHWCGNVSIIAQCGPIGAVVTCNTVDTTPFGLVVTHGVPQLQLVCESDGFEGLMNELVLSPDVGLMLGEYRPGQ